MTSDNQATKGWSRFWAAARKVPVIVIAPILVLLVLGGWALASPVGSSPDDDFHLASIWCADGTGSPLCQQGDSKYERVVPEALVESSCYAFKPTVSAECQKSVSFNPGDTTATARVNMYGAYPPVYYAVMHSFIGGDIQVAVILMRMVNVVLFTVLATVLFLLLPPLRRPALTLGWLITMVPLGLFILASNNPSSWAIMGVGFSWIALLGFFERTGWQKMALGAVFVLSTFIAAGSRSDAALYAVLGIAAVLILTGEMRRRYLLQAILPVVVAVLCVVTFRFSRPVDTVTAGVTESPSLGALVHQFGFNLLATPSLWMGVFGKNWGLGWLDTSLPGFVWVAGFGCFIGAGFVAVRSLDVRKLIVLIGGGIVLWVFPALFLLTSGSYVGENMQPRYLLPLIVLFGGLVMLSSRRSAFRFTRVQAWTVWAALSAAQLVALNLNMQRYIFGIDNLGWNLNAAGGWWWPAAPAPMVVWIVASVAFSALAALVLRNARTVIVEAQVHSELGVFHDHPKSKG